uniref:Glycosyltransferase RgtA/B/C/D-like domain-containing protein n=2 Tax=Gloeothece TaxID=28070 RepID=E0UHW1_GLOV7|nr:conserved hypothetical protein [Gloeothece verrucosa PCC 7822]
MKNKLLNRLSIPPSNKTEIQAILFIIFCWLGMVLLVNPWGNFPLNDDWAYAKTVQSVLEKGDFELSGWTATNLFSQVWWGALFCLPFGFSFTALRCSTLIIGLIGILATYGLLREANTSRKLAFLGTLLIVVNPIYFALSNTFMSDVPFFGFAASSLYLLIRGWRRDSTFELVMGLLLAIVALLTRQVGLAIFLAFGLAYLSKNGINFQNLLKAFSVIFLGLSTQIIYQKWLELTFKTPKLYGNQINMLLRGLQNDWGLILGNFFEKTLYSLIYLGLFIFPFIIIYFLAEFSNFSPKNKKTILFIISGFCIYLMTSFLGKGVQMPLVTNILDPFGIGPLTLRDTFLGFNQLPRPLSLKIFWLVLTAIGLVGAALLIYYFFLTLKKMLGHAHKFKFKENWLGVLIFSTIIIYAPPILLLQEGFFDRYLIILMPLFLMLVANYQKHFRIPKLSSRTIAFFLTFLFISGGLTVASTHDYISWNRVRWQALDYLTQELKISPNNIDGGFEFNGWYLYNDEYILTPSKSWWWVDKDNYIISFGLLTGYKEIKQYSLSKWLPIGPKNLLILQKVP